MIQELFDQNVFSFGMLALCGLGILLKLILNLVYWRLIKASDNMATSKNKLTQIMKKKFETCYKLKIGVNNVDIFVDKYVFRHRFCGILLSTWENICGQILILCLLIGSISTILGLIYECGKQQILGTFSVGILTSGVLIFLEGLINLSGKKELIRLNMKDYLENILKVRLEQEMVQPEFIEQYKKEYLTEDSELNLGNSALAATIEKSGKELRKERKDKLAYIKAEKTRLNKEKKDSAKAEVKRRKEAKKQMRQSLKEQKELRKKQVKEEEEKAKRETRMALERKRELERAEIERIKAEVKAEEEKKKEEKRRQEEIKKALLLEKKVVKEEKHRPQTEYKTVAQERKENLMKEIKERRSVNTKDQEIEVEVEEALFGKAAVTTKELQNQKPFAEKIQAEKAHVEKPYMEIAKPIAQPLQAVKPVIERKEIEKPQIEKSQIDKVQPEKMQAEKKEIKLGAVERPGEDRPQVVSRNGGTIKEEGREMRADKVSLKDMNQGEREGNKKAAVLGQKKGTANKRSKQDLSAEEKLIEDILKEFLA